MDISKTISDMRNGKLTDQDIVECLDLPQKFIVSNAIIKILKCGIKEPIIITKLARLTQYRAKEHSFSESVTIGHLALAALFQLNYLNSKSTYEQLYEQLGEEDRETVEHALEVLTDLVRQ